MVGRARGEGPAREVEVLVLQRVRHLVRDHRARRRAARTEHVQPSALGHVEAGDLARQLPSLDLREALATLEHAEQVQRVIPGRVLARVALARQLAQHDALHAGGVDVETASGWVVFSPRSCSVR